MFIPICGTRRCSWPPKITGVKLRDVQLAARHATPRTTTGDDQRPRTKRIDRPSLPLIAEAARAVVVDSTTLQASCLRTVTRNGCASNSTSGAYVPAAAAACMSASASAFPFGDLDQPVGVIKLLLAIATKESFQA